MRLRGIVEEPLPQITPDRKRHSVDECRYELYAEYCCDAEETRQLDICLAVFNTGNVALLATEFFGELLLCQVEFFATLAEHIAIEPSERFFVELLSQRCAQCAIFFVKRCVGCCKSG